MLQTTTDMQLAVNKAIESTDFGLKPQNLYAPIKYAMSMEGKRVRPIITLMCAQIYNASVEETLPAALAIEIFHNSTLLHDDIMDNAEMRRNQPSVYKKWNTNTAILSGDTMMLLAYRELNKLNPSVLPAALETFNKTVVEVCEGQQLDLDFEEKDVIGINEYLEMIRLKTSVLIACSAKLGAIIGKAPAEHQELLYSFGENIGIAFQLQDDYLDSFGDTKTFGKQVGGDIAANKKTFLTAKALELAKGKYSEQLRMLLSSKSATAIEKFKAVIDIYKQLEIDKITLQAIAQYFDAAKNNLQKLNKKGINTLQLSELCGSLMNRKK